MSVADV